MRKICVFTGTRSEFGLYGGLPNKESLTPLIHSHYFSFQLSSLTPVIIREIREIRAKNYRYRFLEGGLP
jgi:hypothetical protein